MEGRAAVLTILTAMTLTCIDTVTSLPASSTGWNPWGAWTPCSLTCGQGTSTRTRSCPTSGQSCRPHEVDVEMSWCYVAPCVVKGPITKQTTSTSVPTTTHVIQKDWTTWGAWSACSVTCGTGTTSRTRRCPDTGVSCPASSKDTDMVWCDEGPCDGTFWGSWASWGPCSVTCEKGQQFRSRTCVSRGSGGPPCHGSNAEARDCDTHKSCIGSEWRAWSSWGQCSVSCGKGHESRTRACVTTGDEKLTCPGSNYNSRSCETGKPCIAPTWSSWFAGPCSVSCDFGTANRIRHCSTGRDVDCPGPAFDVIACSPVMCA